MTTAKSPRAIKAAETRARNLAWKEKSARIKAENQKILQGGCCPQCNSGLVYNSSLTGWWQCGRYGVDSFRQPQYRGLPNCSFQMFV